MIFEILIKEHSVFRKENNNLHIKKKILLSEALCGSKFIIKHMDNRELLVDIDSIIPNKNKKIIGEGMDENSDLIIEFDIEFPQHLTEQRKTYLKKLLPIIDDLKIKDSFIETIIVDEDDNHDNINIDDEETHNVGCSQQ